MADFSFLSDTDESAVEEILAEAADHVSLKQISALNLSGVSDSVLPQHLESRFRRLKTLPSYLPPATADSPPEHKPSVDSAPKLTDSTHTELGSSSGKNPGTKAKSKSRSARRRHSRSPSPSSSSGSSNSWLENKSSPKLKAEKWFESVSVSPPAKKMGSGGLWGSVKRALKKMSFTRRSSSRGGRGIDWGGNDGVLEGIGVRSLSRKEQERILKRAAKEEMKISQEAEKIAKWAKHVSARMEAFGVIDDDDDELHYK